MTPEDIQKSVVMITSTDSQNSRFGTGFVLGNSHGRVHLLTCAHVIRDVGGIERVQVEGKKAIVIATGEEKGLDLAVLRIEGFGGRDELKLGEKIEERSEFLTAGFQSYGKDNLLKSVEGKIGNPVELMSKKFGERVKGWELNLEGEAGLQPGYSGAPIVDKRTNRVVGVISHREGEGKKGLGIDIGELKNIWKYVNSEQLYHKLCTLGYKKQVYLFQRFVRNHDISALLIYGPSELYGQKWLLNLLLTNHLPGIETSKVVNVDCRRRGKSPKFEIFGREFCGHFGLRKAGTSLEVVQAVYQCWQTRNIILIFDNVDWLGEENLKKLLEEFWQPLTEQIQALRDQEGEVLSKMFMFLIDYQGKAGKLKSVFTEKIEANKIEKNPLKVPEIEEFTEEQLWEWMEAQKEDLSAKIVEEMDKKIAEIIENSEGGIPELTLEEICDCFGYNWFEESEKWIKY
jgi:hypothetical protein